MRHHSRSLCKRKNETKLIGDFFILFLVNRQETHRQRYFRLYRKQIREPVESNQSQRGGAVESELQASDQQHQRQTQEDQRRQGDQESGESQ